MFNQILSQKWGSKMQTIWQSFRRVEWRIWLIMIKFKFILEKIEMLTIKLQITNYS